MYLCVLDIPSNNTIELLNRQNEDIIPSERDMTPAIPPATKGKGGGKKNKKRRLEAEAGGPQSDSEVEDSEDEGDYHHDFNVPCNKVRSHLEMEGGARAENNIHCLGELGGEGWTDIC